VKGLEIADKFIALDPVHPHFNVIFRNVSGDQILLFEEWNSWGFGKLHLEITKVDGKTLPKPLFVTQGNGMMVWFANFPSTEALNPNEALVREVYLHVPKDVNYLKTEPTNAKADEKTNSNRDDYWRFPFPKKSQNNTVTMKAVYEVKVDLSSKQENAWTGRIESAPLTYVIAWGAARR
jgi:hypothetical protein